MIKVLYEVHFQVDNLERSIVFYEKLGLSLAWKNEYVAFLWIEPEKSWLGLWQKPHGDHVFAKHIAFRVDFEEMTRAIDWLKERGIQPESDGRFKPIEPTVRPYQRNASVYFSDPDGHRLELICIVQMMFRLICPACTGASGKNFALKKKHEKRGGFPSWVR